MTTENVNAGGATPPVNKETPPPQDKVAPQDKKPEPQDTAKLAAELKTANDRIAELNEENKKHRLGKKEAEELSTRQKKALELLTGKADEPADPAAIQAKATEAKIRRAYLKAAFTSEAAKQMHDPDFAFNALEKEFADVTVNTDTGDVDKAAITTKLAEVKKARAFLFVPAGQQNQTAPKPPPGNPDGTGQPAGGDMYQQWINLKADPLRRGEAQSFYEKNRAAILAGMK